MTFKTTLLLTLVVLFAPVIAQIQVTSTGQFQSWYPEYKHIFQRILRENCSDEYAYYLAGQPNSTRFEQDKRDGGVETSQLAFPPASCILNNLSEWVKFNMASAAVLLGLTPSILAALGPSVEEVTSLFILARRPLLGMCLAAGAPSLFSFRTVDYHKTLENLRDQNSHGPPINVPYHLRYLPMIVELVLSAGAIANNAHNSYQLGIQTICVFAPEIWCLPMLWVFLGVVAHMYSSLVFLCCFDLKGLRQTCRAFTLKLLCKEVKVWVRTQFTPSSEVELVAVKPNGGNIKSILISWIVSIHITCHVIGGTLTFSSLIFITVRDAITVISRYLASLLVCRAILMYELAVLRDKYRSSASTPPISDGELQALRMTSDHTLAGTEYGYEGEISKPRGF